MGDADSCIALFCRLSRRDLSHRGCRFIRLSLRSGAVMSELIDNRARRIATLKEIIRHLHKGEAPDAVRGQLRDIVRQTDACEIMAMEQELIAGGMPVEEVRSMCDLHSQVTRDVLVQLPAKPIVPGHPVDTFKKENAALRQVIATLR